MEKLEQLLQLRAENAQFMQHNPDMAAQVVSQFREIYIVKLLEHMMGDDLIDLQIAHEVFIAQQVGNLSKAAREAALTAPAPMTAPNGKPQHLIQSRMQRRHPQ